MSFRLGGVVVPMTLLAARDDTDPTSNLLPPGGDRPDDPGREAGLLVRRRLRPLVVASFFQSFILWVPIEKLFMQEIGFDPARLGLMVAAYAIVVPVLEVPSGILADRWSRRGVLMIANTSLGLSALVGGMSRSVATYTLAALFLGVFFATGSGTVDSMIYDTLVEETGSGENLETIMGRLRVIDSVALVSSALGGGLLAAFTSPRTTYFASIPFVIAAIVALLRFREPTLHRAEQGESLRRHTMTTYATLLRSGPLRTTAVAMASCALLLQAIFEFGPLWMVALAAPAFLFGPQWAGLMSASGVGAMLAGRLHRPNRRTQGAIGTVSIAASVTLVVSRTPLVIISAQILLATLLVFASTLLTRTLHDQIPSNIRAGVSSGVGTLTWIVFLPFAIAFGVIANRVSIPSAGWLLVAATFAALASAGRALRL
jgi:MFS family permease